MANKYYLDKSGLAYFWGQVKDWIAGKHYLSYDEQGLTTTQKTQARTNLGVVAFEEQTLTTAQQSQARTNIGAGTYTKPSTGIPLTDLASGVVPLGGEATPLMDGTAAAGTSTSWAHEDHVHPTDTALSGRITTIEGKESGWDAKYTKPSTGIPKTDLASAIQSSLDKADTALQTVPIATESVLGGVKIGTNVSVDDSGTISIADASGTTVKGVVKAGTNVTIANGIVSVATADGSSTLGLVKQGTNVTINSGVISVATASGTTLGLAKQGTNVTIGADGAVSVADASSGGKGVVQLSTDIASDATSDAKAVTPKAVVNYVSTQVGTVFSYGGSIAFASLPSPSSTNLNKIYNITDDFTTTSDFIEGAGKSYPAGTNVICVDVGTSGSHSYKYDVTTGFIDLSPYALESELIAITSAEISAIVV